MRVFLGAHNIISPLGYTSNENFEALSKGKSALQKHSFDFSQSAFCCACLDKKELEKRFSSLADPAGFTFLEKLCIHSLQDVINQSDINLKDKKNLLIISTTKGNIDVLEKQYKDIPDKRAYLPEFAKTIGYYFECVNTPLIVSNACISGLLAMIIAKRFIDNEIYDNIIVCGADLVSEFTLSGFKSFNTLSEEACRPFDAHRAGINLGEAAASILISKNEVSDIIISAGASANDANHISGPSRTGDGLYQAVSKTFERRGKKEIDFISAHGTATEFNDEMESVAFSRSGLTNIPLNSLKGYYGHTLGTAGVLESIISIQSLNKNELIKSMGFESQGTTQKLNIITKAEKKKLQSCLKTASGFGGCNAAAIFEKI